MIKISVKKGDLDGALNKLNAAKKEQNRAFDEQVAAFFAPKGKEAPVQAPAPVSAPAQAARGTAPTYQSILSRSRRVS